MDKKILVIMPVYNQQSRVKYAIQSIIKQTYKNWHLVIVDDCSTDDTFKTLQKWSKHKQITIVKNESNMGCYYSRNRGLTTALKLKYDWDIHTIHDADDVSSHMRFERCIALFENETIMALITRYGRTTDQLTKYAADHTFNKIGNGEGIGFYHRNIFNAIGYYDDIRFGGDSEYIQRTQAWCDAGRKYHTADLRSEILYIAVDHKENLTNIFDRDIRVKYTNWFEARLRNMKITGNFYLNYEE